MKLKIYVLKKKQLYFTAIILAIVIIAVILVISIKTSNTLSMFTVPDSYKADINNDGKVDTIVVKTDDITKEYMLNVICSDENGYILEPDPVIHSFGSTDISTPLKVSFKDINGDNSDEIFVQGNDAKGPILNVFSYNNHQISRIASGRYSFYGLLKNSDELTNTLVLGARYNNSIKLTYLNCEASRLTEASTKSTTQLGVNLLGSIFSYVEQPEITSLNLNIDKSELSKLSRGKVLDGLINDVTYNSNNVPDKLTYLIRVASTSENKTSIDSYKIYIDTLNNNYEIKDIVRTN